MELQPALTFVKKASPKASKDSFYPIWGERKTKIREAIFRPLDPFPQSASCQL